MSLLSSLDWFYVVGWDFSSRLGFVYAEVLVSILFSSETVTGWIWKHSPVQK